MLDTGFRTGDIIHVHGQTLYNSKTLETIRIAREEAFTVIGFAELVSTYTDRRGANCKDPFIYVVGCDGLVHFISAYVIANSPHVIARMNS